MPDQLNETPADRNKDANRFARFASESQPEMPEGYSAPVDTRPLSQRIREQQERDAFRTMLATSL